jgi:hypothetical protein
MLVFSNDHYAVTGSPSSKLYAFRFVTAEKINSAASSSNSATPSSDPSIGSPTDLELCVDLSFYPLQQLTCLGSSLPRPAARQHPRVLHPQWKKTTLLTAYAATSTAPICQVLSPPNYELIVFSDVDRYKA